MLRRRLQGGVEIEGHWVQFSDLRVEYVFFGSGNVTRSRTGGVVPCPHTLLSFLSSLSVTSYGLEGK